MKICFIVGYWNSGTSLLVDLLRRHKHIKLRKARFKPNLEERTTIKLFRKYGLDFIDITNDYAHIIQHGFEAYQEPSLPLDKLKALRADFQDKFGVSDDKWLLIKNPWWFYHPNFIKELFAEDELRTISILREGKHQVVSKDYWLRNTNDPESKLLARSLFWSLSMDYYFEKWFERPGHLDLRYENLCQYPEASINRCFEHLGLAYDDYPKGLFELPQQRFEKWDSLDPDLQKKVIDITEKAQSRLDLQLPVN